jgi:hypothetical protein
LPDPKIPTFMTLSFQELRVGQQHHHGTVTAATAMLRRANTRRIIAWLATYLPANLQPRT